MRWRRDFGVTSGLLALARGAASVHVTLPLRTGDTR
ncbi:hypothetical protein V1292_000929 [Bradyrhizobium sp. AZCC 1719]